MRATARRTPRERSGLVICPRDARGRVVAMTPLTRFTEKCRFDATTGCVLWTGGTTMGRGHTAPYGSFWYDGRRWFAHRWAAIHIHGHQVGDRQVGHCCPHGPDTLCVQHLEPQTMAENLAEQRGRLGGVGVSQSARERQHWLFVQRGWTEVERSAPLVDAVPFHEPPSWFLPFMPARPVGDPDACPF